MSAKVSNSQVGIREIFLSFRYYILVDGETVFPLVLEMYSKVFYFVTGNFPDQAVVIVQITNQESAEVHLYLGVCL